MQRDRVANLINHSTEASFCKLLQAGGSQDLFGQFSVTV